jgi:hypothetical protein
VVFSEKITFPEEYLLDILDKNKQHLEINKVISLLKEALATKQDELENELAYLSRMMKKRDISEWKQISSEIDDYLKGIDKEGNR